MGDLDKVKVGIACEINLGEAEPFRFELRQPARWEVDKWDGRWNIRRLMNNIQAKSLEKQQLENQLANGGNDPKHMRERLEALDAELDKLEKDASSQVEVVNESSDNKKVDKVLLNKTLVAMAELVSMVVEKPKRNIFDWLDEDNGIFDCVSEQVQFFVFEMGRQNVDIVDIMFDKLSSMDENQMYSVKDFLGLVKDTRSEYEAWTKKKSSGVYGVKTGDVIVVK